MEVKYSYLQEQFSNIDPYIEDIRKLVKQGDFTLGSAVDRFEEKFAELCGIPYAVGVSTGTDALALSLKMLGVGHGDEVITTPNTFIASVGAIAMTGATPVFVDNNDSYTIDPSLIEPAINDKTKAILPVHLTGKPADMPEIMSIAKNHNLVVVEDAAQAILASIDGKHVGSWGETAGFSLHPLKNLNVWGDGGIILTKSRDHYEKLRLYRNHGLSYRDEVVLFGNNCRLDSLQAIIAGRLVHQAKTITSQRVSNAKSLDLGLRDLAPKIHIPDRPENMTQVYHTYVIQVEDRDLLLKYLISQGIHAKIHYPIPLHLQPAAAHLGYKKGDFPVCERQCQRILTLPVHQHLTNIQIEYMIETIHNFYLR